MDKAEYKIATEHIKKLISQGEYAEASHIADTIDWRRVKSVMMLCTVSDLYKVNRRYEDAKELLYMAYERNPESRTILYSLCDLSIKLEEFVAAIEYYKSFVEVAPRDTGRYVLQYRLYQAQDVSLEERIEVLEQLKGEEYIEKWAYELAYLYHRIGFATRCVEECDELILWFGRGRYVYKAMELKMLHEPLTPSQQYIYDRRFEHLEQAKDMTRVLPRIDSGESEMTDEGMVDVTDAPTVEIPQEYIEQGLQEEVEEIQVKTLDVANAYNTMNLQKELAASLREILEVSETESSVDENMADSTSSEYADTAEMERDLAVRVAAQEAGELQAEETKVLPRFDGELAEKNILDRQQVSQDTKVIYKLPMGKENAAEQMEASGEPAIWAEPTDITLAAVTAAVAAGTIKTEVPHIEVEEVLIDKQITGQLSIEDILAEWGSRGEKAAQVRHEDVSERIRRQTSSIFAEFDAEKNRDLYETAVNAETAARKERERKAAWKPVQEPTVQPAVEVKPEEPAAEVPATEEPVVEAPATEELATEVPVTEEPAAEVPAMEAVIEMPAVENLMVDSTEIFEKSADLQDVFEEVVAPAEAEVEVTDVVEAEPQVEVQVEAEVEVLHEAAKIEQQEVEPEEPIAEEVPAEAEKSVSVEEVELEAELKETATEEIPAEPEKSMAEETQAEAENIAGEQPVVEEKEEQPSKEPEVESPSNEPLDEESPANAIDFKRYEQFIRAVDTEIQIMNVLDNARMDAKSGNVGVTGHDLGVCFSLIKVLLADLKRNGIDISGKIAKISAVNLNKKEPSEIISKVQGGILVIERAGRLRRGTTEKIMECLRNEVSEVLIFLTDNKQGMNRYFDRNRDVQQFFNLRIDIKDYTCDELLEHAVKYALKQEYSIDEMGRLALRTRIEELISNDEALALEDAEDIINEAIDHVNAKNLRHFMDILLRKRYDEEDRIILREEDFL